MSCTSPRQATRLPNGKISFSKSSYYSGIGDLLLLPCRGCDSCLQCKQREWSFRLWAEHQTYHGKPSSFLTLTYSNEFLPPGGSVCNDHISSFIKRLKSHVRYHVSEDDACSIRYYGVTEYGTQNYRPHIHIIVFGYQFPDLVFHEKRGAHILYTSQKLSSLWPYGHSSSGSVLPQSISYVAGYCLKKSANRMVDVLQDLEEEDHRMSKRPGIGHDWILQYASDVLRDGYIVFGNSKIKIPSYFDKVLERNFPDEFLLLKQKRKEYVDELLPVDIFPILEARAKRVKSLLNLKNYRSL